MNSEVVQRDDFAQFDNQAYLNLATYRKNGEGAKTPVWFVQDGGMFYIRTGGESWKVKRLRNNPQTSIVPSTRTGNPLGEWVAMTAELAVFSLTGKRLRNMPLRRF